MQKNIRQTGLIFLILLTLISLGSLFFIPPIPEPAQYHAFADQKVYYHIHNFRNVFSNALFLVVGIYGLLAWKRAQWEPASDRWPWLVAAMGTILVSLGSSYYHLWPDNQTLFWDRLPMVMVFIALFSAVLTEYVHARLAHLLIPLVLAGLLSLEIWRRSELAGAGDLRFYGFIQYYPMLAIPLILWFFSGRYERGHEYWIIVGFYGMAKIAEIYDQILFTYTANFLSGHTIKHVLAATALGTAFRMLARRKPLISK